MIRLVLAEDHTVVREGIRALVERSGSISVVGEAASGWEAVRMAEQLRPDVVLMDIQLPGLNGIEATRNIRARVPETRVLMLSMYGTSEHVQRALRAGAMGFLLKEAAGQDVVRAIHAVAQGRRFLGEQLSELIVPLLGTPERKTDESEELHSLSGREREVLQLVTEGKTSAEIGELLFLSAKTVETYRSRIMKKLNTPDIVHLVKFAIRHGITTTE